MPNIAEFDSFITGLKVSWIGSVERDRNEGTFIHGKYHLIVEPCHESSYRKDNPELSDKIAKSAYSPINLSLIGINPDACPQSGHH